MGKGKLLPCPFCGGKAEKIVFQGEIYLVINHKKLCYLITGGCELITPGEIEAWNRRKEEGKDERK